MSQPQDNRHASKSLFQNIKNFDLFRQPFRFQFPNGFSSVTSSPGICASVLLVILTMSYGILNIIELANFGKSTIKLDVIDYYFTEFDKFEIDKKPGLHIAFGITHYDDNPDPIDDLDYGEVTAILKTWDGENGSNYKDVKMRPCTYEELGLGTTED